MSFRRVSNVTMWQALERLDREIFCQDERYEAHAQGVYWLYFAVDKPVGFCGCHELLGEPGTVYLSRAGILSRYAGGFQKRAIELRQKWAKSIDAERMITYTTRDNTRSANNLIAKGFKLYTPVEEWASKSCVYFEKILKK